MEYSLDVTLKNRIIMQHYLDTLSLAQLNKVPDGFSNNVFWNIKHLVVTQQLLTYGLSSLPMHVSEEEITNYRKGTKPRFNVDKEEVDACKKQLVSLIERTDVDYKAGLFKEFNAYTVTTKSTLSNIEEAMLFNNFHEGIHLGYILALLKLI